MSYDLWPQQIVRVTAETTVERDRLHDALQLVVPLVDDAIDGARPSAPVAAELDAFLAGHHLTSRELAARIDSALVHADAALDAYVRGDTEMAAEYARASVAFAGPVAPFTPRPGAATVALPGHLGG